MRILDLTSNIDINSPQIISIQPLPGDIPPLKWGNLFATDGKLHLFGGQQEFWPTLGDDETMPPDDYRRPTNVNALFIYDIQSDTWSRKESGLGKKTPSSTSFAYDAGSKAGWVYGGQYRDQGYYVNDNTYAYASDADEDLSSLFQYNLPESKITKEEAMLGNPMGTVMSASMTLLPGVGEKGVLILFGGIYRNTMVECLSHPQNEV